MRPSIIAQGFSGIIICLALIYFLYKLNYNKHEFNIPSIITILLLFSIALGIHGLLHINQEIYYDFNPLAGKWKINDNPRFA